MSPHAPIPNDEPDWDPGTTWDLPPDADEQWGPPDEVDQPNEQADLLELSRSDESAPPTTPAATPPPLNVTAVEVVPLPKESAKKEKKKPRLDVALPKLLGGLESPGLRYDELARRQVMSPELRLLVAAPQATEPYVRDVDVTALANYFRGKGVTVRSDSAVWTQAALAAARNPFHPIRDWLNALVWDGVSRLQSWLPAQTGCEDTALHREYGVRFMIQAVARAQQPGCQADTALVLRGTQGFRKSTFMRALIGADWYSVTELEWRSKDRHLQIAGRWVVELAELAGMTRGTQERVKAYLTDPADTFRPPWGRTAEAFPRTTVFVATCNIPPLMDPTGSRRWWPVMVTRQMNPQWAVEHRDQLWAEAMVCYRAHQDHLLAGGVPDDSPYRWWLSADREALRRAEANNHREDDAFVDWLEGLLEGKDLTSVPEIVAMIPRPEKGVNVIFSNMNNVSSRRVANGLRQLGFERDGKKSRVWDGRVGWPWRRTPRT